MSLRSEKIPEDIALSLCKEIRSKHKKSRLSIGIGKMQCWGCWRFGKKENNGKVTYQNICALNNDDNRGCWQVNKLFDKRYKSN